uniref:Uncharacterized protein n=1 Tax=Monopterus albus TaxID=43700 RepID=A0A3Q3K5P2_MONAL
MNLLEQAVRLRSDLALSHQENRELQERLMVSEATVHAQAEQLKDYRDLLNTCEEVVQLREAVFTARARLKQAELEAKQWKDELRRLQAHSQEQGQQIHTLRQERQASQEKTNRSVCS